MCLISGQKGDRLRWCFAQESGQRFGSFLLGTPRSIGPLCASPHLSISCQRGQEVKSEKNRTSVENGGANGGEAEKKSDTGR